MQNLPNCPPVHPPKQNQKYSAKGLLRAIQNQWTCLQILEAVIGVSMPGCLWLAIRRISLVSESSAGGLWELSWGCKNKKKIVNYSLLWDYLLAEFNLKLRWPQWFLMVLNDSMNLGIHWWAIWGQACLSANWQASLFVLWNNKCQWIKGFTYSEHFQHLTLMKNHTSENKIFCGQEFSKNIWTKNLKDMSNLGSSVSALLTF